MGNLLCKSLNLIDKIINETDVQSIDFYNDVLKLLSLLFDNKCAISIFFCENAGFRHKISIKNGLIIKEDDFIDKKLLLMVQETEDKSIDYISNNSLIFEKYVYVQKLSIRNSIFGFMTLSFEKEIENETKDVFKSLVNAISYKIKDYELNGVFKIQLKALQEAVVEKNNAYEVVKKQHKKLVELDKTKNLFLANISHDLRTPLNAIIGFSQALDSKIFGDLNDKQAEYIKDIQVSSLHLLGMINEILDISKLEAHAMKISPIELNPEIAIKEVISILEPLYKNKNIKVEFNSSFNGLIKADYQKLQQILYNLLSNAIKFTDNGGKIDIIQENIDKDYILKIKDNGIGIEKKYHNKIFKKFVHIDNIHSKSQNSTGLGLPITKQLVKLHNGKIFVESELNKGTTFTMEFKKIVV